MPFNLIMKIIKSLLLVSAVTAISLCSYAQTTNTFPATGNVGIGTTSPGAPLDVKGVIRSTTGGFQIGKFGTPSNPMLSIGLDRSDFANSAIINGWGNSSNPGISVGTTRNDGTAFSVVTGVALDANYLPSTIGTTAFTVLGMGNVGVGTTTPQSLLHVYQSVPDATGFIIQGHTINTDNLQHYVAMTFDGDYGNATGNYSQIRSYSNLYTQWGSHLAFFTTQTGVANTLKERMRIDWNGNVGIGTSTPTQAILQLAAPDQATLSAIAIRQSNGAGFGFDFAVDQLVDGKGYLYGIYANQRTSLMQLDRTNNTVSFPVGKISIGTTDNKGYMLAVNGSAIATSMTVKLQSAWPDYVFKKEYQLPALSEVKSYIDKNHHLSEMPSEQEVIKDGINLGEMNKLLTKKVEELTLYLIEKDNAEQTQLQFNQKLEAELNAQKLSNQAQQQEIEKLNQQLKMLLEKMQIKQALPQVK